MFDGVTDFRQVIIATSLETGAGNPLKMNRQKLLCVLLMCFGFSLVYAAAQQPAAGPPASAPAYPSPLVKAAAASLPDPKAPEEFFARARALSDLEASGIAFHLKATYVANPDAGTSREWQTKHRILNGAERPDFPVLRNRMFNVNSSNV